MRVRRAPIEAAEGEVVEDAEDWLGQEEQGESDKADDEVVRDCID